MGSAGLCEETCSAYVPALSDNQQCMDAFVGLVCEEGVDGTFFGTPYYLLCPDQCVGDCSTEVDDQSMITCLKRRVDVLEFENNQNAADLSKMENNVTGQCSDVYADVERILQTGCAGDDG